jgi:hypothetical protein
MGSGLPPPPPWWISRGRGSNLNEDGEKETGLGKERCYGKAGG